MTKIFKKTLAITVALCLCLTAMVGALSVSAAEGNTLTISAEAVNEGTTTVPVTVRLQSATGFCAALLNLTYDASFKIEAEPTTNNVGIRVDTNAVVGGDFNADASAGKIRLILDSVATDKVDLFNDVTISFNLVIPADTAVASYPISVDVQAADKGTADIDGNFTNPEAWVLFNEATEAAPTGAATGNVTVNASHTHTAGTEWLSDETNHWHVCTAGDGEIMDLAAHTFDAGVVTTQPTVDAEGVKTYTCTVCGATKTETIAKPTAVTANLLVNSLLFSESVGSEIGVNVSATGGLTNLGYSDYYLVINYQSYGSGYVLSNKSLTLKPSDRYRQNAAKTIDYFSFSNIALYEMPLDYTVTIYLKDANGVVTAYKTDTTSVTKLALAYASKYSADTALLRTLTDMVNYGAAAQQFFATANPGTPIASAALPTVGFESYQKYASKTTDLPSSFNTTNKTTKNLPTTTLMAQGSLIIGASNMIDYAFLATGYDASKLQINISYINSYGSEVSESIACDTLTPKTGTGTKVIYPYTFSKLAIYDLEKTVTVKLVYDGVTELTFDYSIGNFVNTYISNAYYNDFFTKMELFSQSARIKLIGK